MRSWAVTAAAVALLLTGCETEVEVDEGAVEVAPVEARVTRVIDGDTLDVEEAGERERVRVLGIDAPEVGRDGQADECGAAEATEVLRQLVDGRDVVLVDDDRADDRDRFGRLLRHVEVAGVDAGGQLVEDGWAIAWVPRSAPRPARLGAYEAAQDDARRDGRGGWSQCAGASLFTP